MSICLNIPLSFLFINFCAEVFHDSTGFIIVGGNIHNATEFTIITVLSGKGWADTDYYFKIIILRSLRVTVLLRKWG